MSPWELFLFQLKLECKAIVDNELLIQIPCADPDEVPRVLLVELDRRVRAFMRHDLPEEIQNAIKVHEPDMLLRDTSCVEQALGPLASTRIHRMHSYTIPQDLTLPASIGAVQVSGGHPPLLADFYDRSFYDLAWRNPVFCIVLQDVAVSACMSWREDADSAEAWVATDPEHRKQGHGRAAVAAWAKACHRSGKVAFYSHKEENTASAGIATSLGMPQWGRTVAFK